MQKETKVIVVFLSMLRLLHNFKGIASVST